MDFKKLSILILILILSLFSVSAYSLTVTHSNADGVQLHYCSPKSTNDNCANNVLDNILSYNYGSSPFILNNPDSVAYWKSLYSFKENKRLVFSNVNFYAGNENFDIDSYGITFTPYLTAYATNYGGYYASCSTCNFANQDLDNDICKGTATTLSGNILSVQSSLNPITKISGSQYAVPESLQEDYYYMKSEIKLNLYKDGTYLTSYYPTEMVNTPYQSSNNFTLLKPNTNQFTFNLPNFETIYANQPGNYTLKAYIKPIDLKCDFNQDNSLSTTERAITETSVKTFTIDAPTCQVNQYFADNNNVQISSQIDQKVFPFLKLTKQDNEGRYAEIFVLPNNLVQATYAGESILSTTVGLPNNFNNLFVNQVDDRDEYNTWGLGDIIFYNGNGYLSYRGNFEYILNDRYQIPYVQLNNNMNLEYNLDTLRTYLEDNGEDFGDYNVESYIISLDDNQCTDNDVFISANQGSFSIQLKNPNEKDIDYNEYMKLSYCGPVSNGGDEVEYNSDTEKVYYRGSHSSGWEVKANGPVVSYSNYYSINNPTIISKAKNNNGIVDIIISTYANDNSDNDFKERGMCRFYLVNRTEYDDGNNKNKIVCNKNKTECKFVDSDEIINLPNTNKNNIKIYKQGTLIRTETVNPVTIALKASAIKKFKTVEQAQEFVDSSVNLMEQFNISKYLNYNPSTDKTTVTIQLNGNSKHNLTLYQIIPKDFANRLNEIQDISNNGQFIVLDKDPVIGWYFNDSDGDEEVNYTLPGDNEGGTIIITQEPILFNEGELIVNYRESNCNDNELQLFTLSDLENSKINPEEPVYHVCLAHLDDTISNTLQLNSNNNAIHIFNYTNDGNMSLTNALTSLDVSTNSEEEIYWNVQYQETNPDGTFSCLGSYNNEDSSTFGDCGYTTNRIWLHLGEDIMPPKTTLSYPYLAHKMKIQLNAEDFGSGVDKTFYCITGQDDDCIPNIETSGEDIYVECSNQWGCVKKIKYYSTDKAGNAEDTKEYLLTLIDQGSACQSDCTAKPTPNRIIKDCINLNGCTFFGDTLDKQQTVAEKCHYATAGTWVQYDDATEVMCPNGPTRKSQFTQSVLKFWDSICDNIQTAKYPVLVNGEQVNMIFVYCDEN